MQRRIFWLIIFVGCIFLACLSVKYDYDLFARLIVGERFIELGILPFKDFLSYTPVHQWYDHEWGSGVIFYLLLKYIGPIGLLLFQAFIMYGIAYFIVKIGQLQKHSYPPSLIFILIFLMLFMHLNSDLVRCQLFSFLFFTIFLYILEKNRQKQSNLIWTLPIITIFWNNVHGGVVAGLGLILMYFAGAVLERKPWKKYAAVFCLSLPVLAINPYGVKYLNFLFPAVLKNRKYIAEWWPFWAKRHFMYYLPSFIYSVAAYCISVGRSISLKKFDITKCIVLTVMLYQGCIHVKLLSLTIITVAALCYNDICKFFLRFRKLFVKLEKCTGYAVLFLGLLIPLFSPNVPRFNIFQYPYYEVQFLKLNNIKGNIVVPFAYGSYVSYKLYPNNLIFMDGRYEEVYNEKELLVLRDYELAENNWKDIVNNYDTDILMSRRSDDIYKVLSENNEWVHLYDGVLCGIFIKRANLSKSYIEPEYNKDYYVRTMFDGEFGKKLTERKK